MIGYINKALKRIQAGPCYPAAGWEMVPILRDAWIERHEGSHSRLEWETDMLGISWTRLPWRPPRMSRARAFEAASFNGMGTGRALVLDLTSPEGTIGIYFPRTNIAPKHLPEAVFRGWDWLVLFAPETSDASMRFIVPDEVAEGAKLQEELRHQAHNRPADASRWDLLMQELRLDGIARPHVKSNEVSQRFALLELS